MGRGVYHAVCRADVGRVAGPERTGAEREQGPHVHGRKEPSSKGSSLRLRPLPQERRAGRYGVGGACRGCGSER